MKAAIVDYGMGNVGSVGNALHFLGVKYSVTADPADIRTATHILLPGVGAFDEGMRQLTSRGLPEVLRAEVASGKPFLGICLGMQLLASRGEEGAGSEGLGLIEGVVRRFSIDERRYPVPHVGWNDVLPKQGARLFEGIKQPVFYFVHSYHLVPASEVATAAIGDYGESFVAAVEVGSLFGVQFHPETSQNSGLQLLKKFLSI